MGSLIFKLTHVTLEEANEVRDLLSENEIEFYETDSGFFGTSVAGLWLKDDSNKPKAKQLLTDYAASRSIHVKQEYAEKLASGNVDTMWIKFKQRPFRFLFAMAVVIVILYLSIIPLYRLTS